jgi:hypothetical protein
MTSAVNKDPVAARFQLKRFRMRRQPNIIEPFQLACQSRRAIAKPDIQPLPSLIVPHIIGVRCKTNAPLAASDFASYSRHFPSSPLATASSHDLSETPHPAVRAIRQRWANLARRQVHNFEAIVSHCRDEQTPAICVDRHVVDPPLHTRQRNGFN